ncbi:DoxX family protein [Candidatus Pacearchaeota archaeon]|nr:DoxX family protein [Candidatus Pacearchaeota archaeon]MBI2057139.1 DoxX family protein [Candidatus Pacearchaeota archaeon]
MTLEVLFLIGRVILGLFFINSGFNHFAHLNMIAGYAGSKKIPFPKFSTFVSGLFLLLGGLSILVGVYTLIGIILLIAFLLPAAFFVHNFWTLPEAQKQTDKVNFMKNLAIVGALLMLLQIPTPWAFSLWNFLG